MSNAQTKTVVTPDRRILRTKKAIRDSFLSLLAELPIEEITVSALTDRAGINRKTFYLHYTSTRELYDEIRRNECVRISRLSCWEQIAKGQFDPYSVFLELNRLIEADRALYRAILSPISAMETLQKIKEKIMESDVLKAPRHSHPELDYYLEYTISGLFALYLRWLFDPHHISIEELAKIATDLTHNGFRPFAETAKQANAVALHK